MTIHIKLEFMTIVKSFELKTGYLQKGKLAYLLKFISPLLPWTYQYSCLKGFLIILSSLAKPYCLLSEPLLCALENSNDKNVVPDPRKTEK